MAAVFKENLSIRRFRRIEDTEGCVVTYLHGEGRIGVLVDAGTTVNQEPAAEQMAAGLLFCSKE